jgi:DNA-binding IclR family transcriptional regulator
MATAPRQQAARSRAPAPRRKAAAERSADDAGQRLGYAVDRQELSLGVWCVAAPIPGGRQTQPAAVSVSAYRSRLDAAEEERLGKLVIAAASRISDRLSGLGNMVS